MITARVKKITKKIRQSRKITIFALGLCAFVLITGSALILHSASSYKRADAACCLQCPNASCSQAQNTIEQFHRDYFRAHDGNGEDGATLYEFDYDLRAFENWMIGVFLEDELVPAMGAMASQMAAVTMQYTQIIGSFLDAQNQIDGQRLYRRLHFQAQKDYRPSEDFCYFGTNTKSLAASDTKAKTNALVMSQISLARQLGSVNAAGAHDSESEYTSRWNQFITTYCNTHENNYQPSLTNTPLTGEFQGEGTGLSLACDHDGAGGDDDAGAETYNRINRDINYTRLIDAPRTIDLDLTNTVEQLTRRNEDPDQDPLDTENPLINILYDADIMNQPGDEEDVLALSRNLYGSDTLSRDVSGALLKTSTAQTLYLALRSVVAKRSVAQASFNAIVGLKSSGTAGMVGEDIELTATALDASSVAGLVGFHPTLNVYVGEMQRTQRFLGAVVAQLLPASSPEWFGSNIMDLIGHDPSYYSQLEILSKRIYQSPDFYMNLYDTPANVSRKKVAMKAIELMVDRAMYESQLRREMSISVLLSSKLRASHRSANLGMVD